MARIDDDTGTVTLSGRDGGTTCRSMRILFVTSETHLNGTGGGVTHTRNMLSMIEMIDGVTVDRLVLPLPCATAPRGFRRARALARSAFSGTPGKTHYLLDRRAFRRFRAALEGAEFDAVVLNGADLLPLADRPNAGTPCVLVSHNVETEIIRGQVAGLRAPAALRRLLRREVEKTRRMEIDGARRMALVIAISRQDALWYRRLAPETRVIAVSGAFAPGPYRGPRPPVARPLQVAYLAKMSWWPNRQGAEWLVASVLPALPAGEVEAQFFGPGSESFDGRAPTLRGRGFVENLDTVWSSAHFTLCPILAGSGINIKLAESLYNGVPVLATPHACRGLPPIDDPALAVVPPQEWAAFLRSERALALASARVRAETVETFAAERQAALLAPVLMDLPQPSRGGTRKSSSEALQGRGDRRGLEDGATWHRG